jgi:hypothetical protein
MVRKDYTTNLTSLSIPLIVGGKKKRIEFAKGYRVGKYVVNSHYSTCNAEEQKAIESSRLFGRQIQLASEHFYADAVKDVTVVSSIETTVVDENKNVYSDVLTMKEAIAILIAEPFNLKVLQCNSKPKIQNRIKELGISFPNIAYDL